MHANRFSLEGRNALVIGGTSGTGETIRVDGGFLAAGIRGLGS